MTSSRSRCALALENEDVSKEILKILEDAKKMREKEGSLLSPC